MKVTSEKVSDIKKKIQVTLPLGTVQGAIEAAYGKLQKKVSIKGFRPGKVPRAMLESHYREDAEHQAIQDLVNDSYGPALDEAGENPVSHPEIKVTQFEAGKELVYEAVFEIRPEVVVKNYKGFKLTQEGSEVTADEVEKNLQALQEQAAQLVPIGDRKTPQQGDYVVVDYRGFFNGKPIPKGEAKDYVASLGQGGIFPEIEAALLEMSVGANQKVPVKMPDNFDDKNLAGKMVDYEITLKDIKSKKLPELTDEFAKDLGPFQTLEEVRTKIREELVKRKEAESKGKLHRQLLEKLIEENPPAVPEGMVQAELHHMYQRFETNLKQQRMTPEQLGVTAEIFAKKNRPEAILQVQGALLFDAIARAEAIHVTPEEVRQKVEEMAKSMNQPPEQWIRYYEEKKMLPGLEAALREEKTLAFVLSHAKIEIGGNQKNHAKSK